MSEPLRADLLRVRPGFALAGIDPSSTPGFDGRKKAGEAELAARAAELGDLQERLYANSLFGGERSLLLVLQAMDTAGKGGIVGHVVGQVNPQGVKAFAFKSPTDEEKSHDFLWRVRRQLPPRGFLGVFDRSHYEDVLIHRVRGFSSPAAIEERYGLINDFEASLAASGTRVVKVMLHISRDEQKERLTERLERPEKHWKYNPGDVDERLLWDQYQEAYQIALERTSTADAPWNVVPADRKWYARLAVQRLLIDALGEMQLDWPAADYDVEAEKARLAAT
jgi:PPK2 family polyphosphate:nucleotide phosphotransferase